MKTLKKLFFVTLLVLVGSTASMQVSAQSSTAVRAVFTLDIEGDTAEYLEAVKPIIARFNEIQPKSSLHIFQGEFAGTETGSIDIVIDHPSMSYMEEMRLKNENDPEMAKLFPKLEKFGVTTVSRGLYLNRAAEQDRDVESALNILYAIDTHGNNNAYVEASKKIHERYFKLISDADIRVYESIFTGESSGMIYIVVGQKGLSAMEKTQEIEAGDEELQRLFAERDKIGATIESRSLLRDVTP